MFVEYPRKGVKLIIVDIHNHVLPGLDDGPTNVEEAIELAGNAVANGITHLIATPHHGNGNFNNNGPTIKYLVNKLNEHLKRAQMPITILEGMQVHLTERLLSGIPENLVTLAGSGKYLLIELPENEIPHYTAEVFFKMQLQGYIPIISHPERHTAIRKDPNRLFELVKWGAFVQINASSLKGGNGRGLQKFTLKLCKHRLVHFMASDAHNPTQKPFLLPSAYIYMQRKTSLKFVDYLKKNAEHVLKGTEFHPLPPIRFD